MTEFPKITVIIPTRERAITLKSALATVTSQSYKNLEIIVSDNYSQDDTKRIVEQNDDRRIRYLNTGERLSMSHNWEFALNHVEDGWVTFIGDDDGLVPNAIDEIAKIINATQALAIRTEICVFDWPGIPEHPEGQFVVPLTSGFEMRNSKAWLEKVLLGKASYNQLPMVYTGGFIHMSLFSKIKNNIGSYFNSINPDVYSAIALSRVIDEYLYVKRPLAIAGTSTFSNGHAAFSTNKNKETENYRKFLSEKNIPLHTDIPYFDDGGVPLSLQVCIYEAYLQSERLKGGVAYIKHQQQLPILLASGGKHRIAIDKWARDFALLHNLNYDKVYKKIVYLRLFYNFKLFIRKLIRVKNSIVTNKLELKNVYDASIAAQIILKKPSRMDSFIFLIKNFLSQIKYK